LKLNLQFDYPDVEQVTLPEGFRYYVCPETGRRLASVTTILDSTGDKSGLLAWKARLGPVRAQQESDYATSLGSLMHEHVEAVIEGRERPTAKTTPRALASRMADQIITHGLCDVSEVWGVEKRLYVRGLYAGTSDLIGVYKNKPSIMDHKSAKKLKKKSDIGDYRDQMAAYVIAHNEKYGTDINNAVIFMATRDLIFQSFEFGFDEVREGKASFLDRFETFMATAPDILRQTS
jgi:hypothetical protein